MRNTRPYQSNYSQLRTCSPFGVENFEDCPVTIESLSVLFLIQQSVDEMKQQIIMLNQALQGSNASIKGAQATNPQVFANN